MKRTRLATAFITTVTLAASACGGGTPGPHPGHEGDHENPPAPDPTVEPIAADDGCKAKDEVKKDAKPTPAPMGCMVQEELNEAVKKCNDGDADLCWGVGSCFSLDLLQESIQGEQRTTRETMAKAAFRTACDAGIADACMARAAMYTDQKTNDESRKAACADAIRACHLGHDIGCADCVTCGG